VGTKPNIHDRCRTDGTSWQPVWTEETTGKSKHRGEREGKKREKRSMSQAKRGYMREVSAVKEVEDCTALVSVFAASSGHAVPEANWCQE
jgi:hypothetical protein